jgi:hypothetical protein
VLTMLGAGEALKWLLGQAADPPVEPLMVRLVTAAGDDDTPGTEVAGGTYTPQALTAAAVVDAAASNATLLRWEGIPANLGPGGTTTVIHGVEIWDSAAAPRRWWHGLFVTVDGDDVVPSPKTVPDGVLEVAAGDLDLMLT